MKRPDLGASDAVTKNFAFSGLIFILLAASIAAGQKPVATPTPADEPDVIRIETELIDVPVSVTDRNGRPLTNLKRTDFIIYEDGKPQEIAEFGATTAPFEVALLLDTSGSTRAELDLIRASAQLFIEQLRPGDRVAVIAFRSEPGGVAKPAVIIRPTDDRAELRAALQRVATSFGTPYYDSLVTIMREIFAAPPPEGFRGRRAIVALTDGVDSTSGSEFIEAREMIETQGVVSYFINVDTRDFFESELLGDCHTAIRFSMAQIRRYYRQLGSRNVEQAANFCQLGDFERLAVSKALYELASKEMSELAERSGGKVFPVGDLSEARNAFRRVATEIGTSYRLGYYSTNESRDGRFRQIKVSVKGVPAGTVVRAREGYTAKTN